VIRPAERTGETAAVERDRLEHLATLADANAAAVGNVAELALDMKPSGDVWLRVHPEVLFKDIEVGARMAGLFNGILPLDYLTSPAYLVTIDVLTEALEKAGCPRLDLNTT
jgi:hypothetical protein